MPAANAIHRSGLATRCNVCETPIPAGDAFFYCSNKLVRYCASCKSLGRERDPALSYQIEQPRTCTTCGETIPDGHVAFLDPDTQCEICGGCMKKEGAARHKRSDAYEKAVLAYSPERRILDLEVESSRATVCAGVHAIRQHRAIELIKDYRTLEEIPSHDALLDGVVRILKGES